VIALKEVKKENVVNFIQTHIIYRYGVPRYIITDNGKPFFNKLMTTSLCEKFKFAQHKSSMYHAPANGLVEAFNKTLCNLLKKVVAKSKRDWHEKTWRTALSLSNYLQDASAPLRLRVCCGSCLTFGNSYSITSRRHTRRLKQGRQSQTPSSGVRVP